MSLNINRSSSTDGYRLLLVEDNPAHAKLIVEILRDTPCQNARITHVTSLTEALDYVGKESFDLALLDLGLPESRGMETFTRFHSEAPSQPVVVLTSLDDEQASLKIVKAGAEDYLPKEEMAGSLCRTIRHATERARLSSQLMEREHHLRTILNQNLDGMVVINRQGQPQYTNSAALRMLGVDGADRIMTHIQQTTDIEKPTILSFDPDDKDSVVAEIRIVETQWDNQPAHLVSLRDITLRRQMEKNLYQAQKMEMIGTLASGIAHDFNNILSAISGLTQVFELHVDQDSEAHGLIKEDAKAILDVIARGNFLIRDLLHLGRPQTIERYPTNLNDLLFKTEKLVATTIRRTHMLHFEIPDIPCYIKAAPENLEQVLINLIMNARDATEKNGKLQVRLDRKEKNSPFVTINGEAPAGDYVCVTVKDSGSGISPETCARIFEPFFTTKDYGKGTGLGMFVVSGIVKQHEGWIVCDTELGRGTIFSLFFPRIDPDTL